ncbi:VPLPA-CTERM protein sorting domain-containing protein [Paracoccus sediminis]|nr:VPLPA-CTERM protein sorting domain-containing protein [Paracoccus sediminis]
MHKTLKALIVTAGLSLGAAASANAATLTFTNADPTPQFSLTVDDSASPGKFRFSLSTLVGTADLLGLGFFFGGASLSQSDISLVSATRADNQSIMPTLELFGNNTGQQGRCGQGCNFNGSGSRSVFDYIIRLGDNGAGQDNFVKSIVFDIAATGPLATLFSDFGVRAQRVNGDASIKTDLEPNDLAPVPLPAGLPLLGSGLLAMGILRRRRAAKTSA